MTFDEISNESEYHGVQKLPDGSIVISAREPDSEKGLRGFQGIIAEAKRRGLNVSGEHRYTQHGLPGWRGPIYDRAKVNP